MFTYTHAHRFKQLHHACKDCWVYSLYLQVVVVVFFSHSSPIDEHAKTIKKSRGSGPRTPVTHRWHHSTALQCQAHLRPQQLSYLKQQGHSLCHCCPSIISSAPLGWKSDRSWTLKNPNPCFKNRDHPQVFHLS